MKTKQLFGALGWVVVFSLGASAAERIEITTPSEGELLRASETVVVGRVEPKDAHVVVNGVVAKVQHGVFVASGVTLTPGENVLTAVASYEARVRGRLEPRTLSVTRNVVSAPIALACVGAQVFGAQGFLRATGAPVEDVRRFRAPEPGASYLLRVRVGDDVATSRANATISVNGETLFRPSDFRGRPGVLVIEREVSLGLENELSVRLRSGPRSFVLVEVERLTGDVEAPVVTVLVPSEGSFHNTLAVDVEGQAVDPNLDSVVAGGLEASLLPSGSFEALGVPLAVEGLNEIFVVAKDVCGNESEVVRRVVRDTISPVLTLDAPADGAFVNAPVTVTFSASDINLESVGATLDGVPFASGGVVSEGGPHQLVVTARDLAGNETTASRSFVLDFTLPEITVSIPSGRFFSTEVAPQVTVTDTNLDSAATVLTLNGAPFSSGDLVSAEGDYELFVLARDRAGNEATVSVLFTLDFTPPEITIAGVTDGLVTQNDVTPVVTVTELHPASETITLNGVPFSSGTTVTAEDDYVLTVEATDLAGNTASASVSFAIDRNQNPVAVPDSVTTFETLAVTVDVVANDVDADGDPLTLESVGAAAGGTTVISSDAGGHSVASYTPSAGFAGTDSFSYTVTDGRGGSGSGAVRVTVLADEVPPTITASVSPPANADGWHHADVSITFDCQDDESRVQSCTDPVTISTEGAEQLVTGDALDNAGNSASRSVSINLDRAAPVITLSGPASGRAGQSVRVTANASDALGLQSVVLRVDGVDVATLTAAPFEAVISIPASASAGSFVSVDAVATDFAGNQTPAPSLSIEVLGGGFVQGEVYDDSRGLPLAGAGVTVGGLPDTTDPLGRFGVFTTTPATPTTPTTVVTFDNAGFTSVERVVSVSSLTGTLVLDARLTPLDATVTTVPIAGGAASNSVGTFTLSVPAGALAADTDFRLTEVLGQGLKAPLPLGWSPIGSVDIEPAGTSFAVPAELEFDQSGLTGLDIVLASYDIASHQWIAKAVGLIGDDFVTGAIDAAGAYAFVVADTDRTAPPPASVDQALPASEAFVADAGLSATGEVTPAASPVDPEAAGVGSVFVTSLVPLASGTIVSARVEESFDTFDDGELRPEPFTQELVLYKHPVVTSAELHAEFPVTPTLSFTAQELREGRVHVEVRTSPDVARGTLVGAEGFTVIGEGGVELAVPAGAVTGTTAVFVESIAPADAGLSFAGFPVVGGAEIDLGGASMALPGTLSLPVTLASPDNLFAARYLFVSGQRKLRLLAPASFDGTQVGVTGIETSGTFFFFQSDEPLALVQGTVTEGGSPANLAVVESSTTPFMDITAADGVYLVAAKLESTTLTARSLVTGNQATASVTPTTTDTQTVDLALAATGPFVTEVTPEDGSLGVALAPAITTNFSEPVDASTVTTASFVLTRTSDASVVPGRVTLGSGNRSASFLPDDTLESLTSYTLELTTTITDTSGNALLPVTSLFTTLEEVAAGFAPDAITVSFPDGDGQVTVSAAPGSFESGASVLIINNTQAIVASGIVLSDGSFSFNIQAAITDEIQIRVVDSADREVVIEKTEYIAPDGRVAIGRLGGSIRATGDLGEIVLEVPEGALSTASVFTLTPVPQSEVDLLPVAIGAQALGAAVTIDMGGASLSEEADLKLPLPPAADPASDFAVLRKVEDAGVTVYEVIDSASLIGGEVTTDSFPFPGVFQTGLYATAWFPPQPDPGKSPLGVITGIARESDNDPTDPTSGPLAGVRVEVDKPSGLSDGEYFATTGEDGRFTLFDPDLGASATTAHLIARDTSGREQTAVAFASDGLTDEFPNLSRYVRVADVFFNFPLSPPPPPPVGIEIGFFKEGGAPDGSDLEITNGFVGVGEELLIKVTFDTPPASPNVTINAFSFPLVTLTPFDYEVRFTPADVRAHTVTVTAFDGFLNEFSRARSFMAATVGDESNNVAREGPPSVLTDRSSPQPGEEGVAPTSSFGIFFTEPVTGVSTTSVRLVEVDKNADDELVDGAEVEISITGSAPDGTIVPAVSVTDRVTTLTITPTRGLRYDQRYKLTLDGTIQDTDTDPGDPTIPTPNGLDPAPTDIDFTTFEPEVLGEVSVEEETTNQVEMAVLGTRAFIATQQAGSAGSFGMLLAYDVKDPANPVKLVGAEDSVFVGTMVRDIGVEAAFDLGGLAPVDVVGVLSFNPLTSNANLTLFNVSEQVEPPYRYEAVVTTTLLGQFSSNFDLFDGFGYVAAGSLGLEVVDLQRAAAKLDLESPVLFDFDAEVFRQLFARNVGYARETITHTIPIRPTGANLIVADVTVAETALGMIAFVGSAEASQFAKLSSLRVPQNVASPALQHLLLVKDDVGIAYPSYVEQTRIGSSLYVIVSGGGVVVVVDATDPSCPSGKDA